MNDIVIILLLILLNGIFSMSEIALISARKSRLTNDAKRGSAGAAAAIRLSKDPDRFLSTIQIGITLIGILTGLYSGAALADDLGKALLQWGLCPNIAHNIAQISICFVTPSMIAPMACSGVMGGLLRYLNSGEDSGMISDVMTELR